jgi:predicted small secreted protein
VNAPLTLEETTMLSDDRTKSALGLLVVPAVLSLVLLTGGCNTMEGMGEDVQAAGGAMSGTASDTKEMMKEGMEDDDTDDDSTTQ